MVQDAHASSPTPTSSSLPPSVRPYHQTSSSFDISLSGIWSQSESLLHINHLELLAVFRALQKVPQLVEGRLVLIKTDNSTVVSYLNRQGGTHSPSLCMLTWELLNWFIPLRISLLASMEQKYNCGCSVTGNDHSYRLDSPLTHSAADIQLPRHPSHRPVCFLPELSIAEILHLSLPPTGMGDRCTQHRVDKHPGLCLSTNLPSEQGSGKDREREVYNYSHSPLWP